jgi:hypothetical protein
VIVKREQAVTSFHSVRSDQEVSKNAAGAATVLLSPRRVRLEGASG